MVEFIAVMIFLFILVPVILLSLFDRKVISEEAQTYTEVFNKLEKGENEEKIKEFLRKKHKISIYESSLLLSVAKKKLKDNFENILSQILEENRKKERAK
jgi:uncharacterized membrane protein YhiD involved in acid resistance